MEANDMAACREALEYADEQLRMATESATYGDDVVYLVGCMRAVAAVCRAALAKPPRQCDVGTPEEQHCRFIEYCNACDCPMGCIHRKEFIGMLDARCASMLKCYIRWSQMPYEEGANGK